MSNSTIKDARTIVGVRGDIEITNQEAYRKFLELSNDPILNEKKFITVSDGRTLSLGYPQIMKLVSDLPEKEQQQVAIRKKIYNKIHGMRNAMYMKAYGTIASFDGIQKKKGGKISPLQQRKEEIIELFGRMFSLKEVHEVCLKDWDLKVTTQTLNNFREVNKHVILQKIEEYKRTYDNVRLGHKRPRIEELSWMYMKRKAIYEQTHKVDDHRLMLQTLEQLRKEVEGDTLRIDGNMNLNMELTIRNQIENEMMKNILVKEIIISRVCSKIGIDPTRMLTSIKESFYKSRLEVAEDIPHEEIIYPSAQTYDFQKIEMINRQKEEIEQKKNQEFIKSKEISPEELTTAERLKKSLIAKLAGKKEAVNKIKNSAFFNTMKQNDE